MKILLAPDKFKGTLSAMEVCDGIKAALLDIDASLNITSLPLADGGEGTCDLLTMVSRGTIQKAEVVDPLFRNITAEYGISGDGTTAFIEMAKASGLYLLKEGERNPLHTTTFGTGQLIAHAMKSGVSHIILGIGGSATNDAGMGMAAALGYNFLDGEGKSFIPNGQSLASWETIKMNHINPQIQTTRFTMLCDVDNPLCGPNGAAYVFGPQKGAHPGELILLDKGLLHFEKVAGKTFHQEVNFPGAGAGGGIGAGARLFLKAEVKRGFDFMAEYLKLEEAILGADLVITGEGKIDQQSLSGKVVSGVATLALKYLKPCLAIAGQSNVIAQELNLQQIIVLAMNEDAINESFQNPAAVLRKRTREEMERWFKVKG